MVSKTNILVSVVVSKTNVLVMEVIILGLYYMVNNMIYKTQPLIIKDTPFDYQRHSL